MLRYNVAVPQALQATLTYYSAQDIALRIMPMIVTLALDPDKQVRGGSGLGPRAPTARLTALRSRSSPPSLAPPLATASRPCAAPPRRGAPSGA